ncbi:MAG TPA: LamG-like jellyroll fold domain-containing protein [Polyangiaceae bacterium]|nr:LamG-like jellyroll fold domain-containing protein [Polyangiaceae bacterium]
MKSFGIGFGITGLLLAAAACSDNAGTPATGTGGNAGANTVAGTNSGGSASGSPAGGMAGTTTTAGTGTSGTATGISGGGSGGVATGGGAGGLATAGGGAGGASGAAGAAGASGSGGSGGGVACDAKPGKAIKFAQGVKDLVAGDLGADGTLGDKPRTLELWAKFLGVSSWTAEQSIIELGKPGQPDDGNNVFGIDMSGRNPGDATKGVFGPYTHGVSDNNGTGAMPQYTAPVDVGWLHLSWSYDPTKNPANTRLEFTVNGVVLPTEFVQAKYDMTGGKLVGNTGFVLLGASQNFGNTGWDGVMDEVRIWTVYRTPQQVKDNMNVIVKPTTPGLLAYYQFNEADAANVKDSTGNAAHKLAACMTAGPGCPSTNTAPPTFVDSDIPGAFTCAP